jgi:tetraacyldisaccharide 4'-kinase
MGELAAELAGARAAFIGGTFDPRVGGHSPMEAWLQGVAVFAGEEVSSHAGAFHACGASFAANPAGLAEALTSARPPPLPPPDPGARVAACVRALAGPPAPESPPRPWAMPLAPVVRAARHLRGRPRPVDALVVAVGSANARGSGKTSVGRAVARQLQDQGHVVGVVVRGHRRARPGSEVRLSNDDASAAAIGDEGALYARYGLPVASGSDRHAGAQRLIAQGCTAVVLDDGLQQRSVEADVRIDVVDARFPCARGPMPAGEGRPTAPADLTVALNGHWGDAILGRRIAGPWHRGTFPAPPPPGPVAVFAGLPRPADLLTVVDVRVDRFRALPNHAPIGPGLARSLQEWADGLPMVCSARDWVRLPTWLAAEVWWRDQRVELDADLPLPGPR